MQSDDLPRKLATVAPPIAIYSYFYFNIIINVESIIPKINSIKQDITI